MGWGGAGPENVYGNGLVGVSGSAPHPKTSTVGRMGETITLIALLVVIVLAARQQDRRTKGRRR